MKAACRIEPSGGCNVPEPSLFLVAEHITTSTEQCSSATGSSHRECGL